MSDARGGRPIHAAPLTRREALLFEAGVKLGGIFHQYLGTPVSRTSAASLARAVERAVALQPYVRSVRVRIDPSLGGPVGTGRFAYRYLTPPMMRVTVTLSDGPASVTATLRHRSDLRYTLMSVTSVRGGTPAPGGRRPRR